MTALDRLAFDRAALAAEPFAGAVIGVDEVGRGALAGPVVAAAFRMRRAFLDQLGGGTAGRMVEPWSVIHDSKKLSANSRKRLVELLGEAVAGPEAGFSYALGQADVEEIGRLNILGATRLAMARALEGLLNSDRTSRLEPVEAGENLPLWRTASGGGATEGRRADRLLIDGRPLRPFRWRHCGVIGGDGRSLAIAAASIIAKEARDAMMRRLDAEFPDYGFARNVGYGTAGHRRVILNRGATPHHRALFLRKVFGECDIIPRS